MGVPPGAPWGGGGGGGGGGGDVGGCLVLVPEGDKHMAAVVAGCRKVLGGVGGLNNNWYGLTYLQAQYRTGGH